MKITGFIILILTTINCYFVEGSPAISVNNSCGILGSGSDRIIGGRQTTSNAFPWQALLIYQAGGSLHILCGGSLINHQFVVTAAHCIVPQVNTRTLLVSLGNPDLRIRAEPFRRTVGIWCHPRYNSGGHLNYDAALVKLASPVTFNQRIAPICLPTATTMEPYQFKTGIVSGYGTTSYGSYSLILKYAFMTILNEYGCTQLRFKNVVFSKSMTCAYRARINPGTACHGDGGGPLITLGSGGRYELVGISSYGVVGCPIIYPTYFTSVPEVQPWIRRVAGIQ